MTAFDTFPASVNAGGLVKFIGGAIDDSGFLWMIPHRAAAAVRVDTRPGPTLGNMSAFDDFPASAAAGATDKFWGGAIDATGFLWFVPGNAAVVVRVDTRPGPTLGNMTGFDRFPAPVSAGDRDKFVGGAIDAWGFLWLVPTNAAAVVRVDTRPGPTLGKMTAFEGFPAPVNANGLSKFYGGAIDAAGFLWLVPRDAAALVRVDTRPGPTLG
eukprot:CAMPEP_0174870628 /NCGR_PEP_ID=MMETSP1114-20130205/70010_1 /TAXON_ID=312471 /ORGANISM="Neobodo designis, Strain CCAP 1951/1" /LENGTH=211 /DNA_ID=CAMNT_0016105899 /DNA_START=36 /DNA_END=667 /DNA_ORIENTATION=+